MLLLSDDEISRLLTMKEVINTVEKAFIEFAKGGVKMPQRLTIMVDEKAASISFMPSYIPVAKAFATKIISIYPTNPMRGLPTTIAWIIINDPETGMIKALLDGTYLTAMRTGAVTGVAARYLAPKDCKKAAIIGCGVQGRTQAWAVAETCNIEKMKVFDLSKERMARFSEEIGKKLGIDVLPSDSVAKAVEDAEIVITATTSKKPLLKRKWLGEKVHVSAIGAFYPNYRELDSDTIKEAKVVVDSKVAAIEEAGDILIPIKEGAITEGHIYAELGDLVLGRKPGRLEEDGITVFKSVGLAIQDSSVANLVLRKWRES